MESVFGYFVAIGSGIGIGLTIGSIPALLIWRYWGGVQHARKAPKGRN